MEHGGRVERSTGRERFPKSSHLRSSQDFQRVRRRGKRQQGRLLQLSYARREAASDGVVQCSRIGLAVNKRVGIAVQRNRVKRRLREAIRRRLWKAQPGWDMIVTARPESADADYAALADELHELLTRARLLREETF